MDQHPFLHSSGRLSVLLFLKERVVRVQYYTTMYIVHMYLWICIHVCIFIIYLVWVTVRTSVTPSFRVAVWFRANLLCLILKKGFSSLLIFS